MHKEFEGLLEKLPKNKNVEKKYECQKANTLLKYNLNSELAQQNLNRLQVSQRNYELNSKWAQIN